MRLFGVLALLGGIASAQPAGDDAVRAEAAVARGMEAAKRGDDAAALAAYREAESLAPNANVPHKLAGEVLERLGRYPEALEAYRRYLTVSPNGKSAGELQTRIGVIEREHVGTLVIPCEAGVRVILDGVDLGTTPLPERVLVAPRSYDVRLEATARKPLQQAIALAAGARTEVPCTLAPIDLRVKEPPPEERPPIAEPIVHHPTPWYRRAVFLGPVIGAAVAIAGVGVYLAVSDRVPDSDGGSHPLP